MGCCLSLLGTNSSEAETELTQQGGNANNNSSNHSSSPSIVISNRMSSRSIQTSEGGLKLHGRGLALVGVSIEQDAAYWEWHVETTDGNDDEDDDGDDFDAFSSLKFGVATKKNSKFYQALESNQDGEDTNLEDGTALMKTIAGLQDGDTVGVAVQQSDLPMVQFLLNGEPLHELAINRFRGTVYPSVYLQDGFSIKGMFQEDGFKEISPHVRFGPLIAERGII